MCILATLLELFTTATNRGVFYYDFLNGFAWRGVNVVLFARVGK